MMFEFLLHSLSENTLTGRFPGRKIFRKREFSARISDNSHEVNFKFIIMSAHIRDLILNRQVMLIQSGSRYRPCDLCVPSKQLNFNPQYSEGTVCEWAAIIWWIILNNKFKKIEIFFPQIVSNGKERKWVKYVIFCKLFAQLQNWQNNTKEAVFVLFAASIGSKSAPNLSAKPVLTRFLASFMK